MKIHEYYKLTAKASLNGSMAALIPATIIIGGNLLYLRNREIMGFSVPFLLYSLVCFQIYLFRMKQSMTIEENMVTSRKPNQTLFEANNLLVINQNLQAPSVLFFFPDGQLAGKFEKYRCKDFLLFKRSKLYVLCNQSDQILGYYKIKGSKKIEVFNDLHTYLGCFEITKKGKKELLDASGKFIGAVEGASFFMDERISDNHERLLIRLQKGWMPVEWSNLFPEPNTPVLSFSKPISDKEKLLRMSFLVHEFLI
jgi:hypothetical protein